MNRILLTFGDSWPAGAKLADKTKTFPKLIADSLEMGLVDLSIPATSIDHSVLAFFNFLEHEYNADNEYTALFCLTDISRGLCWRQGDIVVPPREEMWKQCTYTQELQINNKDEWSQNYYKNLHSTRLELYNYHKNLLVLRALCKQYNINDFYVHNFYDPRFDVKILDGYKIYPIPLMQLLNSKPYREYIPDGLLDDEKFWLSMDIRPFRIDLRYLANDGHPTEAGHAYIAETLGTWIRENNG